MPGRMEFEVKFSTAAQGKQRRSESSPMQILLMGNFSGISDTALGFPIHTVDIDNFDLLMAKLAPRLALDIDAEQSQVIDIEFKSLDDFHPDHLFDRLMIFQHLKEVRSKLNDPATFAETAAQLALPTTTAETEAAVDTASSSTSTDENANLLDELLGERAAHIATEPTAIKSDKTIDINQFIKNAIAPHIEPGPHPQRDSYIASVDLTISKLMRTILHHPQFQTLEAVWRGVYECITRLETDESLKVYLLDASKEQLQQDFQQAAPDLTNALLYQSVVENSVQTLGGESWSVIAGLYTFSAQEGDVQCLKALGQLAHHAGGPFIAAADGQAMGCQSLVTQSDARQWQGMSEEEQKTWTELRRQPYASWLALVFPRFILRLPYGAEAEEVERFQFEEMPVALSETQRHDYYLWGNAAIVCAVLIGQSYQNNGWSMGLGDVLEFDELPWHVYNTQGEKTIKPCAEAVMSERSAEVIERYGIMPLMSYKDRNAVRLWRFRSLAEQNGGLAGPWTD